MVTLRTLTRLAVVGALSIACSPAYAAPCAGFGDVDDTSPFCSNVEWLKNRAITLGCTGAAAYCPSDVVTRLSMSAFLQRLGLALIPSTLGQVSLPGGASVNLAASPVLCGGAVNRLPPATFPGTARGHAVFMFKAAGSADVSVEIVESTNNGATWTSASPINSVSAGDQQWATLAVLLPPRPIAPGDAHEYGLRVSRTAGSATAGNPSQYSCRYKIYADNRNPSTPPFDE